MTHCETNLSCLENRIFWRKWRWVERSVHYIKVLVLSAAILFAGCSFAVGNTASNEDTPVNFWFQSVYSGDVMINKIRPLLSSLNSSFNHRFGYQSTLSVEYLLAQIEKRNFNVILWGRDPFLTKQLDTLGYRLLLSASMDISLYQLAIEPKNADTHLSRTETFTVGILVNSTALNTVKKHYLETQQHVVSVKEYESYIDLMRALTNAEIDYIAATSSFIKPMIDSVKKRYRKVFQYPQAGTVSMLSNLRDKRQIKLIQDYFIANSPVFNRVFGTGVFTLPQVRQSDVIGTAVE